MTTADYILMLGLLMVGGCGPEKHKGRFDAQADIQKGDIHLINHRFEIQFAGQDSLTHAYGFYIKSLDSLANDADFKEAETYNRQIITYLCERNGDGWYDKFRQLADSRRLRTIKTLSGFWITNTHINRRRGRVFPLCALEVVKSPAAAASLKAYTRHPLTRNFFDKRRG